MRWRRRDRCGARSRTLARWARFLADGHPEVLARETLREMSAPRAPAEDYGLGLQTLSQGGRRLVGHGGTMPGFRAGVFVDPERRDGVVVLCNATTGLDYEAMPRRFLERWNSAVLPAWVPTERVPDVVLPTLGVWFWGNTALELRWQNELRSCESSTAPPCPMRSNCATAGSSGSAATTEARSCTCARPTSSARRSSSPGRRTTRGHPFRVGYPARTAGRSRAW